MEFQTTPTEETQPVVFVMEDDPDLQAVLSFHLQKEGYKARCFAKAEEVLQVLDAAPSALPAALVVDINLAGNMNGLEATKFLRRTKHTASLPILMLTAKGENGDITRGLDEGADDYLPKPFDMGVFVSRLRSCIRRGGKSPLPVGSSKSRIAQAGIEIDPVSHKVVCLGKDVELTLTEFNLLASLMYKPNEVLGRDDLLLRLVGPNKAVTGRTIDVHVRALRAKLGRKSKHIVTVRGVGYKFVP